MITPASAALNRTPNSYGVGSLAASAGVVVAGSHKLHGQPGSLAAAVVNVQVSVLARALPATSFTPALPPITRTVYVAPAARAACGCTVASPVAAL
ncbi:hypothetical protein D3C83_27590 [compost metagenome]